MGGAKVAGVIRRYGRVVAGVLLLLGVLLALVATHVEWVRTAERVYASSVAGAESASELAPEDEADAQAKLARWYRENKPSSRTGRTTLRIRPAPGLETARWEVTAKHKLALAPEDPMVEDFRRDQEDLDQWLPLELFVGGDGCPADDFDTDADDDRLEQAGQSATVYALEVSKETWAGSGVDCTGEATHLFADVKKGWLGKSGLYDRWTLTVDTPQRPILAVEGATVLSQSAHRAELLIPARGLVRVTLGTTAKTSNPGDLEVLAEAAQSYRSVWREASALLVAVTAVTCCWVLPFLQRWAPNATRARWSAAAVASGVLTTATLAYALASTREVEAPWWEYAGSGMPLVAWWWVLLPFLLGAFVIRAATVRPPQLRQLLPLSLVPGVVPLIPALVLAATGRTAAPLLPVSVGAVVTALVALVLNRGVLGPIGRRWAATVATGVWMVFLSVVPGTGLPNYADGDWVNSLVAGALSWGWAALLWPVLMALGWRWWTASVLVGTVWCLLAIGAEIDDGAHSWIQREDGSWLSFGVGADVAANRPLLTMQTVLVCCALLYLSRHVCTGGKWPPHLRAVASGLGILAVATAVAQFDFVSFGEDDVQRSGRYLAVAIAAVGFAVLLPQSAESRAARLQAVTSRAHNHRMHALLKDQTLEASRREFLAASRTALAEGELTAREWSRRWKKLGALGARGTAPQHSVALRLAALGSSGGRDAWRNGVAGAVLLTVGSLPWLCYTLPPLLSVTSQVDNTVQVWAYALRWPLYGFVYGYAYSWLRGGTPLGKAMCLLAVVLTAELTQLLYQGLKPGAFGVSLLLTTGNCLAVFLVLGLYWEVRLVRAAGLRWGQIRNFKSFSAIAVPATTVLVAAATAMATAMVGVWVAPGSAPPAENPTDQPSATAPRDPGP
jgi:hypothetical protein